MAEGAVPKRPERADGPTKRGGPSGTIRGWLRSVGPERKHLKYDLLAGLPGAIGRVPDGMAAAVLAGVSPVHGLYASFAGPIAGGLATSTQLMVITTTSAAALAAGSALQGVSSADRPDALVLLTLIAGIAMIGAGLARLGRYTRFVSHSVMIGFLTGVAANIFFGQIPDLTGAPSNGAFALEKAFKVLIHPTTIQLSSLLTGLAAFAILMVLARTRWAVAGAVLALVIPTAIAALVGADLEQVKDIGQIPSGFPLPQLPNLGVLSFSLVTGAFAVAAIVLVQGAGVAEAAANRDGRPSSTNRDFIAQGIGNLAAGLFRGQPVGGSVGQTALNIATGARSRWASIISGVWLIFILVLFSGLVGNVAMPTLAAVLMFAAIGSLRPAELRTIMRTGRASQIAVITTFAATLFLPVAAAVGIGVALSLLLQINQDAMDLAVVELMPREDGRLVEQPAPRTLPSNAVTVLDVYGSLFYAGARTLQARLPDPTGSERPAVVLRLRGRTSLGSTFFVVLADYAKRLSAVEGRLYLSGMDPSLTELLRRTGRVDVSGPVRTYEASEVIGESTREAYLDAEAWLIKDDPNRPADTTG